MKKERPYSMSTDRSGDYFKSGASVLLDVGRALINVCDALPMGPFGRMCEESNWSEDVDRARLAEAGLKAAFESAPAPSLRPHLVNPAHRNRKNAKLDWRVTRAVATLATAEILLGRPPIHMMELATLLAVMESKLFPAPVSLVLEIKRTISLLAVENVLQVRENCAGRAIPDVRLEPATVFEIMGGDRCVADAGPRAIMRLRRQGRSKQGAAKQKPRRKGGRFRTAGDMARALEQIVVGQPAAVKALATRGFLHLRRAELLEQGQDVGGNECLLFMGPSGSGKTFLAENFGHQHALPFACRSATDMTAMGYVGHNLTDSCVQALVSATEGEPEGSKLEAARFGCLFLDEWDKKRSCAGQISRDVGGTSIQHEILRLMEGATVPLGARRMPGSESSEFNSNGTMFIFAGAMDGFEAVLRRVGRRSATIGFDAPNAATPNVYLRDALIDYGFIPEFVNRLTAIVPFNRLRTTDLVKIAVRPGGVIHDYNAILGGQGLTLRLTRAGLQKMAEICVESDSMARGVRSIVGALVEDALFNGAAKGEVRFGRTDVEAVAEQLF